MENAQPSHLCLWMQHLQIIAYVVESGPVKSGTAVEYKAQSTLDSVTRYSWPIVEYLQKEIWFK